MQFIDEAIGIINTEIYIIRLRIKYPEQFRTHFNTQPLSPLYLADKTNLIDIMEMVSGLFLSKDIVYQNGKPAYLVDLAKAFEWLFNIRIGDCYQKHEDVIKRKPGKLTGFLNGLVELIKKEHDKKGYRYPTAYDLFIGDSISSPVISLRLFSELCFINRLTDNNV